MYIKYSIYLKFVKYIKHIYLNIQITINTQVYQKYNSFGKQLKNWHIFGTWYVYWHVDR